MKRVFFFFPMLIAFVGYSQSIQQKSILYPLDSSKMDGFGTSIAVDDNYLVIGSQLKAHVNSNGDTLPQSGAVYIFEKDIQGTWQESQKLIPSDIDSNMLFGNSVAIWGKFLVVGAVIDDNDSTSSNSLIHAGSAYIFLKDTAGNWIEHQKLFAFDRRAADQFGRSVDISSTHLVISAPNTSVDSSGGNFKFSAGGVYFYELDIVTNKWLYTQKITPFDRSIGDDFGWSLDLDSNQIAIGARSNNELDPITSATLANVGAAFVFKLNSSGKWIEEQKILPNDFEAFDGFGVAVAINDSLIVCGATGHDRDFRGLNSISGAGAVYIFGNVGFWYQADKVTPTFRNSFDGFGRSINLKDSIIIVGSQNSSNRSGNNILADAGSVYILKYDTSNAWEVDQKIISKPRSTQDHFGDEVKLFKEKIFVGSPSVDFANKKGKVFEFTICDTIKTNVNSQLCQGDSILIGSSYQSIAGVYYDTLKTVNGCDSIIANTVSILPISKTSVSASICQGDSLFVGGAFQIASGSYFDTLTAVNSCDSIITTNLSIITPTTTNLSTTICSGDSILLGGSFQKISGIFNDTLISTLGCDSILSTTLSIQLIPITNKQDSVCFGDSLLVGGSYQTTSGTYFDTLNSIYNCDSVIATLLSIIQPSTTNQNASICSGDSILLGGNFQKISGIFYDTLISVLGCDSIISTTLSIRPVQTTNRTDSICFGDSLLLPRGYQSQTGVYQDTVQSALGCDSILITNLTVSTIDTAVSYSLDTLFSSSNQGSYQWLNCQNFSPIIGATNQWFVPNSTGNFAVEITDNNCTDTSACQSVIITGLNSINGIKKSAKIYPNPTNRFFFIESEENISSIEIYSVDGMFLKHIEVKENPYQVDVNLPDGTYILKCLADEKNSKIFRLLVIH